MPRSFVVTATDGHYPVDQFISLDEVHLNIWYMSRKKIFVESGLMLKLRGDYLKRDKLSLSLYPTFCPRANRLCSIEAKLCDDKMIRTLFNSQVKSHHNIQAAQRQSGDVIWFELAYRNPFIVLHPEVTYEPKTDAFQLEYDLGSINKCHELLAGGGHNVFLYSRFRYQIDLHDSDNLFTKKRLLNYNTFFDLRFNSPRTTTVNYDFVLKIRQIHLFIIIPAHISVEDFSGQRRYVRFLENDKWLDYFEPLNHRRRYMVHNWKEDFDPAIEGYGKYNLFLLATAEKSSVRAFMVIVITLLLAITFSVNSSFCHQLYSYATILVLNIYAQALIYVAGLGAILKLIGPSITYDGVKAFGNAIKKRFSNLRRRKK